MITPKSLEERYFDARVSTENKMAVQHIISKIMQNKSRYQHVAELTNVPWWMIAVIHSLESNCNFSAHLHNGDPLYARTTRVPRGRPVAGSPPFTWEESAVDALVYESDKICTDSLGDILDSLEKYNGLGYRNGAGRGTTPPRTSPYLWSYTDQYVKGKYVADGRFDPDTVSQQAGAVALIKVLAERGAIQGLSQDTGTGEVGWFEAHIIKGEGRTLEIGIAAKEGGSDRTLALARFEASPDHQLHFLSQFPDAKSIVVAPRDKPWPGDYVPPRTRIYEPFTEVRTFKRGEDIQLTKNFHLSEMECKCGCGTTKVSGKHMQELQAFRDEIGVPIDITSGYRCRSHNIRSGGVTYSQHLTGTATDIVTAKYSPDKIYQLADARFAGVGKYEGMTHVDSRENGPARW